MIRYATPMFLLACAAAEPAPAAPPADFAAIAAEERRVHPDPRWMFVQRAGEGRVVDFRGRPVAGARVVVTAPTRPATTFVTDAEGRWPAPDAAASLEILATGWSRAAYATTSALTGDATLVRGPRTLGVLAGQAADPTERAWLAAELLMGDPEGEDGPSEGGQSSPEQVATDAWLTGGLLMAELRGFAALPCGQPWDIGCRALQMLADEADPQDDARVGAHRTPPLTPVSAASLEALCGAWEQAVQARERDLPPGGCQIRARRADVARVRLDFRFAHWGFELEGIARLEGAVWRLIDERKGTTWHEG